MKQQHQLQQQLVQQVQHKDQASTQMVTRDQGPTLVEIDGLIKAQVQPLAAILDTMQKSMPSAIAGGMLTQVGREVLVRQELTSFMQPDMRPVQNRADSSIVNSVEGSPRDPTAAQVPKTSYLPIAPSGPLSSAAPQGQQENFLAAELQKEVGELQRKQDEFLQQLSVRLNTSPLQSTATPLPPSDSSPPPPALPLTPEGTPLLPPSNDKQSSVGAPEAVQSQGTMEVVMEVDQEPEEFQEHPHEDDDEVVEHKKQISLKEDSSLQAVFTCDGDVENPPYDVKNFYYHTGCMQAIARSEKFANLTMFVVGMNAVYIGIDSDYNTKDNIYDAAPFFLIVSQFFAGYFTLELIIRFLAFESKHNCLKDGWFKFDLFLVSTMILDIWVIAVAVKLMEGDKISIPTQPLRMLRLFKLTRMARLMKAFPELVTMIKGMIRALRAISSTAILIGIMTYTWAILMHMLLSGDDQFNKSIEDESSMNFRTILDCMWILFMDGTLMLDNAAPLMTELVFGSTFQRVMAGGFFVFYSWLSALLILQMLIGILCEVVLTVNGEQRNAHAVGLVKQELLFVLREFDQGDGKINETDLDEVMRRPHTVAVLKAMDINTSFLRLMQKNMFPKPTSRMLIKTVCQMVILCKNDSACMVETLAGGINTIHRELKDMRNHLTFHIKEVPGDTHERVKTAIA